MRIWTVWILIFGLLFAPWVLVINGQVEGETSPNDVVVVKDSEFTGDEVNVELFDPTASDLIEPQDPLAIPEDPELMEGQSSNYAPMTYGTGQGYHPPAPAYQSPYQIKPGSYSGDSYGGYSYYTGRGTYNRHGVYSSYLGSPSYMDYSKQCMRSYGQTPRLGYKDLNEAFNYALHKINLYTKHESSMYSQGNYLNVSVYSTAARHQIGTYRSGISTPIYFKEKEALFNEYASKFLMKHYCLSKLQANYLLPQIRIGPKTSNPYGDNSCYAAYGSTQNRIYCADSKYRTPDGSCNNLYHPYWGKSFICHLRLVPAAYEDGIEKPRIHSYSGGNLPNPRIMSSVAHSPRPDRSYYSHMKMVFGQFINHDILLTPVSQANYKGGLLKCCPKSYHPQCLPIEIPSNDYYQARYGKKCMNFVRSAPCPLCTLGPREQQNIASSFLDLGLVYGNSREVASRLRTYQYGSLKTQRDKCGREILPPTNAPWEDQCSSQYPGLSCFDSGDPRVSQHPGLQLMHTLWLRQHNIHAKNLHRVNPYWSDEKIYQEAKRITTAQLQHITYHEYLPIVFGPALMKYFDLDVNYGSGYTRYEPYTDPTTWNDFAMAGRFGHSQISSFFSLIGYGGNSTQYMRYSAPGQKVPGFWIRDWFFNPDLIYDCAMDGLIQGLLTDPSMTVDPWVDGDVHNYLYRAKNEQFGSDLGAFNIQRGRDHGLPAYHVYLDFCFGVKVKGWDDLAKFIPYEEMAVFRKLYRDWRDVELWPAVISERKYPDSDLGPTAACIVGIQYYHLKFGDRYFYSHGHQTGSFSPTQLSNIKQVTTLSSFLCKTSDYLAGVQKYSFFPVAAYNPIVSCSQHPDLNYNLWKDTSY